jgi:16S rRNA (adenine1518-N6/adenine1519-N6)-dimethyltransferase
MCDAARVTEGDIVLEVGPGTGVLTSELLKRGATVVALEADARAIAALEETFVAEIRDKQLILVHTDVREMDFTSIPLIADHEYKVVANIPYYLSGHLFRSFLEASIQPKSLVFLVQKEVGKRITDGIERGGKESILSLSVKVYGTPTYVKAVSKGHFNPPPKIDSAIILVQNISRDNFKDLDPSLFFQLLHIGFGQKRKQLIGNLSKHYDRNTLTNTFSTLSLSVSIRAEDVPLEKWLLLAQSLSTHT